MPRRCRAEGCTTILSTYNPDPECFLHQPAKFGPGLGYRERQKRQAEIDCDEQNCRHNVLDHEDRSMSDLEWNNLKRRHVKPKWTCAIHDCTLPIWRAGLCVQHAEYRAQRFAYLTENGA